MDYADWAEVQAYDERMSRLRDVEAECAAILDALQLAPGASLVELGTGTGAFARAAARRSHLVCAVDVSPVMLAYASERARREGLSGITFHLGGFLTYSHQGEPADAAVSQLALHHIPDVWKLRGLQRVATMLRPGGRLHLTDVVYPDVATADLAGYFERLVGGVPEGTRGEMVTHVRREYSTFSWIMEGLLARSGFVVERVEAEGAFLQRYLCRRA